MTKEAKIRDFDQALLDAPAEKALSLIEQAGDSALPLIEAWRDSANAAAIAAISERGNGPIRKAARRALNVLKSRGVSIPEKRRVSNLAAKSEPIEEAWMLAPDATGTALFVIASHTPASRYQAAFVMLNDKQGVFRVERGEMSQSQLKESMAKLAPGIEYKPVTVPVPWVRFRIAAARKLHHERGAPEPLGFTSAAELLEPVPTSTPSHPFDDEGLELSDEDALELASAAARLHMLAEFRGWFPTSDAVDELLAKVGETLKPGENPDPEALWDSINKEVLAATDRYFSPQRREVLLGAMKDSALSVLAREGEVRALEVVACMKAIAKAGLITDPPHEILFLRAFFEKAVSVLLAQGQGKLQIPVRGNPDPIAAGAAELSPAVDAAPDPPATTTVEEG